MLFCKKPNKSTSLIFFDTPTPWDPELKIKKRSIMAIEFSCNCAVRARKKYRILSGVTTISLWTAVFLFFAHCNQPLRPTGSFLFLRFLISIDRQRLIDKGWDLCLSIWIMSQQTGMPASEPGKHGDAVCGGRRCLLCGGFNSITRFRWLYFAGAARRGPRADRHFSNGTDFA